MVYWVERKKTMKIVYKWNKLFEMQRTSRLTCLSITLWWTEISILLCMTQNCLFCSMKLLHGAWTMDCSPCTVGTFPRYSLMKWKPRVYFHKKADDNGGQTGSKILTRIFLRYLGSWISFGTFQILFFCRIIGTGNIFSLIFRFYGSFSGFVELD